MRPDSEIFAAARRALDEQHTVPASVRVHVDRGVVTLTGSVRWTSEQVDAGQALKHIPGIRGVVNEIVVSELPSVMGFEPPEVS